MKKKILKNKIQKIYVEWKIENIWISILILSRGKITY